MASRDMLTSRKAVFTVLTVFSGLLLWFTCAVLVPCFHPGSPTPVPTVFPSPSSSAAVTPGVPPSPVASFPLGDDGQLDWPQPAPDPYPHPVK